LSPDQSELETRLDDLTRRVAELERRLGAETAPAVRRAAAQAAPAAAPPRVETLPLIGRTLLVLAGAFLLRAITEAGAVPRPAGTLLGVVYALAWLVLAYRAARRGARTSATFHGMAMAAIAFPLLWEAAGKFHLLSPAAGGAALAALSAVGLGLAAKERLRRVAWVITIAAVATAGALAVPTRALVLFAGFVVLLGLVTLWLGYLRGWSGLGWFVAVSADLGVSLLTMMVLIGKAGEVRQILTASSLVELQLALLLIYCGSLGVRTLVHRAEVTGPEIAQGAASLVIGLGGAVAVTGSAKLSPLPLGVVNVVLAVVCYAVAFAFIARRSGARRNFIFYTTLALVFTLVALHSLPAGALAPLILCLLALVGAWLGTTRQRATLTLHGAVYVVGAAITSGLLASSAKAMIGPDPPATSALGLVPLAALAVAAACVWCPVALHGRTWGSFSRVPKLIVLLLFAVGLDGVLVILLAALMPAAETWPDRPAYVAAARTGALALTALGLAWAGRFPRFVEARWLVYPWLVAGGVKLLLEDVSAGRAAALVLSFALYGGALIAGPRLLRRAAAS